MTFNIVTTGSKPWQKIGGHSQFGLVATKMFININRKLNKTKNQHNQTQFLSDTSLVKASDRTKFKVITKSKINKDQTQTGARAPMPTKPKLYRGKNRCTRFPWWVSQPHPLAGRSRKNRRPVTIWRSTNGIW